MKPIFSFLFFFCVSSSICFAGVDLGVYGEFAPNERIGLSLDQGSGPWHGIVFLQYTNRKHVGKGNQLRIGLNTDTLWLAWDWNGNSNRRLVISPYLLGQFGVAKLTPDFLEHGIHRRDLSFFSFYGEAGTELLWKFYSFLSLRTKVAFRYWFFQASDATAKDFVLPLSSPSIRGEFSFQWEQWKKSYLQGRLQQFAKISITTQAFHRFQANRWGTRELSSFQQDAEKTSVRLLFQAKGSLLLHKRIGLVAETRFSKAWFADDLHRLQVGGDNPFVPMISGTYFSEFLVDSFFLQHLSFSFLPWLWWKISLMCDVAWLSRTSRLDPNDSQQWLLGVGVLQEFFIRSHLRIQLKLSGSPNVRRDAVRGGWKFVVSFLGSWW